MTAMVKYAQTQLQQEDLQEEAEGLTKMDKINQFMGAVYLHSIGYGSHIISKIMDVHQATVSGWVLGVHVPIEVSKYTRVVCENEKRLKSKRMAGEKNPMWKGDKASVSAARQRAHRKIGKIKGYDIHHIDGNPYNNDKTNLVYVTRKDHMIVDGRLNNKDEKGKFKGHNRAEGVSCV